MLVLGVVWALAVLTAAAFVLAPLVRPSADLRPLDRPRAGVRDLVGATADEREDGPRPVETPRRCFACGRALEPEFDYCDRCLRPVV